MLKALRKFCPGQSIVEYLILLAAIITGLVAFTASNCSPFRQQLRRAEETNIRLINSTATGIFDEFINTSN